MSAVAPASLPEVVIVGRPNVGKSTLLNRILGRREAIVEEKPGVTRDRKEVEADWQGRPFRLVDTGGWLARGNALDDKVSRQAEAALARADVVLFVVDAAVGVTEEDSQAARLMHSVERPVVLVANKVDDDSHQDRIWDLVRLGLGEPWPVSSIHGRGVADLLDHIVSRFDRLDIGPDGRESEPSGGSAGDGEAVPSRPGRSAAGGTAADGTEQRVFSVALVGRPNVGKSTLFNRLTGEERSVVHDMPGTTRDTIDTLVETDLGTVRFLDTAGMRRRSRVDDDTEYYSVVRSLKAVDSADVALLIIDASEGVTQQDQRLAERIDAAGCPTIVVLNKTDLMTTAQREDLSDQLARKLSFLPDAGTHRISALSGKGVSRLVPSLGEALEAYQTRAPTRRVNEVIRRAQQAQPAPGGARVLYATQGATDPPTFTLFANRTLPDHYLRYLERKLREEFDLGATPIKLRVRRRSE
ncbi:MAG: ribosome biogenesis GTPase Der [Actinomycetota bacterium]